MTGLLWETCWKAGKSNLSSEEWTFSENSQQMAEWPWLWHWFSEQELAFFIKWGQHRVRSFPSCTLSNGTFSEYNSQVKSLWNRALFLVLMRDVWALLKSFSLFTSALNAMLKIAGWGTQSTLFDYHLKKTVSSKPLINVCVSVCPCACMFSWEWNPGDSHIQGECCSPHWPESRFLL